MHFIGNYGYPNVHRVTQFPMYINVYIHFTGSGSSPWDHRTSPGYYLLPPAAPGRPAALLPTVTTMWWVAGETWGTPGYQVSSSCKAGNKRSEEWCYIRALVRYDLTYDCVPTLWKRCSANNSIRINTSSLNYAIRLSETLRFREYQLPGVWEWSWNFVTFYWIFWVFSFLIIVYINFPNF